MVFSVVPMVSFWLRGGAWFHRPRLATSFQIGVSSLRSRVCSIQHTLAAGPNLNPNRTDPLGLTFGSALAHPALSRPPASRSINHDPSRIPADLPEARCLCLGCVNPFTMQEDRSMVSVPVFSQVPVRRRLCPQPPRPGPCRQRVVMETIAVGCTCIF